MTSFRNMEARMQALRSGTEWLDSARLLVLRPGSEMETDPNSAAHLFRYPAIIGAGIDQLQCVKTPGAPRLCDYCDSIDLERLFDASIDRGRMNLNGRFVAPLSSDRSCPLCCLLASITPPWWNGETVLIQSFYFFGAADYSRDYLGQQDSLVFGPGLLTDFLWGTYGHPESVHYLEEIRACGFLAPTARLQDGNTPSTKRIYGRAIQERCIDFELVKGWITRCCGLHDHSVNLRENFHPALLIDCNNRMLVYGSESREYVALSYVWGKSDPGEPAPLYSGDHLSDRIPVVVEDSLMVVRRLGYRYLWVDKYCVQQTMNLEKEIRNMGKIYSNAVFTIIAAAGQDAAKGLPGVNATPRVRQPQAGVKGRTLVSTMTQLEILLLLSKWQSRGWVFQEEVFSRRRLYFTEQQVHFRCDNMQRCETVDLTALEDNQVSSLPPVQEGSNIIIGRPIAADSLNQRLISRDSIHRYWDFVKEYTKRDLTFDSDSLAGFLGVLDAYSLLQPPLRHCWGIPLEAICRDKNHSQADHGFGPTSSLCWEHTDGYDLLSSSKESEKRIYRRPEFPSWSWAGWAGAVQPVLQSFDAAESGNLAGQLVFWPRNDFRPEVRVLGNAYLGVPWETLQENPRGSLAHFRPSHILKIHTKTLYLKFEYHSLRRSANGVKDRFLDSKRFSPGFYTSLTTTLGRKILAKLNLSTQIAPENVLWLRLLTQRWKGLVLHASDHWENDRDLVVMIVDRVGNSMERIGIVHFNTFKDSHGTKERFVFYSVWETVYLR
jgi:hypothetical protein